jgi:hypothetical protein
MRIAAILLPSVAPVEVFPAVDIAKSDKLILAKLPVSVNLAGRGSPAPRSAYLPLETTTARTRERARADL